MQALCGFRCIRISDLAPALPEAPIVTKDCNRRENFEGYLKRFPNGEFAALACAKLKALRLAGKRP